MSQIDANSTQLFLVCLRRIRFSANRHFLCIENAANINSSNHIAGANNNIFGQYSVCYLQRRSCGFSINNLVFAFTDSQRSYTG